MPWAAPATHMAPAGHTTGSGGYPGTSGASDGDCPPVPFTCNGSVIAGVSGSGWVSRATALPPPPPAPTLVVRKITNGSPPAAMVCGGSWKARWKEICPGR